MRLPTACPDCDFDLPVCGVSGDVIPRCSVCGTVATIPAECYAAEREFEELELPYGDWVWDAAGRARPVVVGELP